MFSLVEKQNKDPVIPMFITKEGLGLGMWLVLKALALIPSTTNKTKRQMNKVPEFDDIFKSGMECG